MNNCMVSLESQPMIRLIKFEFDLSGPHFWRRLSEPLASWFIGTNPLSKSLFRLNIIIIGRAKRGGWETPRRDDRHMCF